MGRRRPALDGLRGVAVLLVVSSHVDSHIVRYGGAVGVTLFFVLSGFLITRLLLDEHHQNGGRIRLGRFYARRARRLLPALSLVLLFAPLLMWLVGAPGLPEFLREAAAAAFYAGDIVRATGSGDLGPLGHTWSLAVEEQFYLLWPVALLIISRRRMAVRGTLVVVLALSAIGWRLFAIVALPYDWAYFAPACNAFGLLLGCALAMHPSWRLPSRWEGPLLASVLVLALLPSIDTYGIDLKVTLVVEVVTSVLAVGLIAGCVDLEGGPLTSRVLRWFGTVSYGWYLWHKVLMAVHPAGVQWTVSGRAILALLGLLFAWLSYRWAEQRFTSPGRASWLASA